jgi:DNA-binding XRE family transcriptional regulator
MRPNGIVDSDDFRNLVLPMHRGWYKNTNSALIAGGTTMIAMTRDQAQGRVVSAARMLAGLDQSELAALAGVSASTVSNIEKGRSATSESIKSVRRALREKEVNVVFANNQALASICFVDRNSAEDE